MEVSSSSEFLEFHQKGFDGGLRALCRNFRGRWGGGVQNEQRVQDQKGGYRRQRLHIHLGNKFHWYTSLQIYAFRESFPFASKCSFPPHFVILTLVTNCFVPFTLRLGILQTYI